MDAGYVADLESNVLLAWVFISPTTTLVRWSVTAPIRQGGAASQARQMGPAGGHAPEFARALVSVGWDELV